MRTPESHPLTETLAGTVAEAVAEVDRTLIQLAMKRIATLEERNRQTKT